jgi:hypothetical protein
MPCAAAEFFRQAAAAGAARQGEKISRTRTRTRTCDRACDRACDRPSACTGSADSAGASGTVTAAQPTRWDTAPGRWTGLMARHAAPG